MPYTLKPNKIYAKDPNSNNYLPQNVITDQSTAEEVAAIEAKGAETLATIPSDYTALSNEVGYIGGAFAKLSDDLDAIVTPGDYDNGDVLFTNSQVPAGTTINYYLVADTGTAAYIDVRSTADGRITYIGKGASSSGDLKYEGSYTLPSNYGAVKVGTTSNAKLHIYYLSTNIAYVIDKKIDPIEEEIEDVEDALNATNDKLSHLLLPSSGLQDVALMSKTDNQLDENNYIQGIGINRSNNTFVTNSAYKLSKIIPFGDATGILVTVGTGNPVVATMTEPYLENRFINNTFLVSGSRSINKEVGINYFVVDLTNCTGVKVSFGYNGEAAATPTQEYAEGQEAEHLRGVASEMNDRKQLQAIFDSETDNVLDLKNKVWGYRINSDNTFSRDRNSAISKFIYVGDIAYDGAHQVTVAGYSTGGALRLAFLSEAKIDNSCVLNTYLMTNSSRTVTVPKEAKYAVLMLATNGVDYSKGVVLRRDGSTSSAAYKPRFLGWPGFEKDFRTNIRYYNEDIRKLEALLLYRRWLPMAYGKQDSYTQGTPVVKRVNLMFFSDPHIDYGNAYESRQNVLDYAYVANNTPLKFDAVVCGGDIMTRPNTKSKKIAEMKDYFFDVMKKVTGTPVLWAVGNHDCNDMYHSPETGYTPSTQDVFGPSDYNDMWFNYAETTYGIVRQTRANGYKSTYHYYDIAAKKTRIICVDVNDVDKSITESGHVKYHGSVGFYISQEQMNWITGTALNLNTDQNWTVIFVLHQAQRLIGEDPEDPTFYAPEGVESAIEKLLLVCQAYNNGTTYSSTYTNSVTSFNLSINVDYTSLANKAVRPRIACWLLGHEHADNYVKLHDINIIHIMHSLAYDYAYGNKNTTKTLGSFNQSAFDVVNIDPDERKIRLFRYGAGVDCYGDGGDRFLTEGLSY